MILVTRIKTGPRVGIYASSNGADMVKLHRLSGTGSIRLTVNGLENREKDGLEIRL